MSEIFKCSKCETEITPKVALQILKNNPKFRIIRRIPLNIENYDDEFKPEQIKLALFLDTETTGLDHNKDKIWDFAGKLVEFCPITGTIMKVVDSYTGLEDPGVPISDEIKEICNITPELELEIEGSSFDDKHIEEMVKKADVIVAHNAGFDRKFVEKRWISFIDKTFACSLQQLTWSKEGIRSQKLDYICYAMGFFYDAHRAMADVDALIYMLTHKGPETGINLFKQLYDNSQKGAYSILAYGASFDKKDALKSRNYRWNADKKVWYKVCIFDDVNEEKEFLDVEIYRKGYNGSKIFEIKATDRFSTREE